MFNLKRTQAAAFAVAAITLMAGSAALPTPVSAAPLTPPKLTVDYAADRRIETDSGDLQGRVHAAPGMERTETRVGDVSSVLILRTDRKIGWTLMPAQKMYQELDLGKASQQAGSVTPEQTELERVGEENVSGLAATKYKFVTRDKSAGGFLWYTATGIPVKMDVLSKSGAQSTRMTVTLENIQLETQDPALFEIPAGYRRMPSASGFLGNLGKAVTRPVKSETDGIAEDITTVDQQVTSAAEEQVTEEVRETGARAAVRNKLRSLGGLLRNR